MPVRSILFHPALWFVVATIVTIVASIGLWTEYQDKIVKIDDYSLTADSIRLSEPEPEWTDRSIKQLVLEQIQNPSTLNRSLVANTAEMIRSLGWVENVGRVEKSKSGMEIDLVYRHPVAMVKINDKQLLPVDRNGVIIDGDLIKTDEVAYFMRVCVYQPIPLNKQLLTWQVWPDERIKKAAAISWLLKDHWQAQELIQVVTFQMPGDRARPEPFELWTHGHIRPGDPDQTPHASKIVWGNAPGFEAADEADAIAKIQAIDAFIVQRGPLKTSIPRGKMLDVRSGRGYLDLKNTHIKTKIVLQEPNQIVQPRSKKNSKSAS